jgi:hypothetical protein
MAKVAITVATIATIVLVPVSVSASGPAQKATGGSVADLAVSSPPDPITAAPGAVAATTLTVGNLGHGVLDVSIIAASVTLLDNGGTRFSEPADPLFVGRTSVVPNMLSLAGHQERRVRISVHMPTGLSPNDYFLGFLVTPLINASSVTVVNDIGALVVLNVPGPRFRKLTASFLGLSWLNLSLSGAASGIVRVKSVGASTLQFDTTTEINGWPSAKPSYFTVQPHLLPPGLYRDIPVQVSSFLGLGWYTFHTTLVYNLTDQTTGDVVLTRSVVVLNPLWFLVFPFLVLVLFAARRRRHKPPRRGLHRVTRGPSPARRTRRASRP